MAFLYITEYARQALDYRGIVAAGEEPAITVQKIAIAAGSTSSAAFNAKTRFVELHTDAVCHVRFGAAPQTAVITDKRMAANQTQFFGVKPGDIVANLAGV